MGMNIGQVAAFTGLTVRSIRHYETLGFINPKRCESNHYRTYSDYDLQALQFIQQCRQLGFSLKDCQLLLSREGSADAERLQKMISGKLVQLDQQLTTIQLVRENLVKLIEDPDMDVSLPPLLSEISRSGSLFRLV